MCVPPCVLPIVAVSADRTLYNELPSVIAHACLLLCIVPVGMWHSLHAHLVCMSLASQP